MKTLRRYRKIIASLLFVFFLESVIYPSIALAGLTSGPTQPEFSSFEPVDATDMVNLVTGDFTYTLPLINVPGPEGGYPMALSYSAGIPTDEEASWVGLGWSLNPGAINRSISNTPDDWNGAGIISVYTGGTDVYKDYQLSTGVSMYGAKAGLSFHWDNHKSFGGGVDVGFLGLSAQLYSDYQSASAYGYTADSKGNKGFSATGLMEGIIATAGFAASVAPQAPLPSATTSAQTSTPSASNSSNSQEGFWSTSNISPNIGISMSSSGSAGISSIPTLSGSRSIDPHLNVNSSGFGISISVYCFYASFGYTKTTVSYDDVQSGYYYGALNNNNAYKQTEFFISRNNGFDRLSMQNAQSPDYNMDVYNVAYDSNKYNDSRENEGTASLMFPAFDRYMVSAQGLSGTFHPFYCSNMPLYGKSVSSVNSDPGTNTGQQAITGVAYKNTAGTSTVVAPEANFIFDGDATGYYFNNGGTISYSDNTSNRLDINTSFTGSSSATNGNGQSFTNSSTGRTGQERAINYFTNSMLIPTGSSTTYNASLQNGFLECEEMSSQRATIPADGIGAYTITTPDGKCYHYSLPEYNYEQIVVATNTAGNKKFVKFQNKPYAYNWLLTAITGPDFVDKNSNGMVDDEDYGYWVKFNYGKWSDGYLWRDPYTGSKSEPNTDFSSFQIGRKQLYYLNSVETKTHKALFYKSIREDGLGANATGATSSDPYQISIDMSNDHKHPPFRYADADATSITQNSNLQNHSLDCSTYYENTEPVVHHCVLTSWNLGGATYQIYSADKVKPLKLDKVMLFDKKSLNGLVTSRSSTISNATGYINASYQWHSDGNVIVQNYIDELSSTASTALADEYWQTSQISTSSFADQNVNFNLYTNGDLLLSSSLTNGEMLALQGNCINETSFDHDYSLCKGVPNQVTSGHGKLTLNSLNTYGRNHFQTTLGYGFTYNKNKDYNADKVDDWGYYLDNWNNADYKDIASKPDADTWSLSQISLPTGGILRVNYEPDDYSDEAALGSSLPSCTFNFVFTAAQDVQTSQNTCRIQISSAQSLNLSPGATVHLHLRTMDFTKNGTPVNDFFCFENDPSLTYINDATVVSYDASTGYLYLSGADFFLLHPHVFISTSEHYEDNQMSGGSYIINDINYKGTLDVSATNWTGGGLRVKSLVTDDNQGKTYKTEYTYNTPGTSTSSGITSYKPFTNNKFIPYISELPGPMVLYQYVTAETKGADNASLGKVQYHFETLQPTTDPNPTNLQYKIGNHFEVDDQTLPNSTYGFWVGQYPVNTGYGYSFQKDIGVRNATIKTNYAALGRVLDVKAFDNKGFLLGSNDFNYYSNTDAAKPDQGLFRESYNTSKVSFWSSDQSYPFQYHGGEVWNLVQSNKISYPSFLKSVSVTTANGQSKETDYTGYDFYSGAATETQSKNSYGDIYRSRTVPAYTKYATSLYPNTGGMASKIFDPNNKNMLDQVAEEYLEKKVGSTWRTMGVGVTDWSNYWTTRKPDATSPSNGLLYTDAAPSLPAEYIWRKSGDWVWKGDLNTDGSYKDFVDFCWGACGPQDAHWQNVSRITKYDVYSHAIEAVGISGSYSSSKLSIDESQVFASISNSNYEEFAYCGFEDFVYSPSTRIDFGGEIVHSSDMNIDGAPEDAHTGDFSLGVLSTTPITIYRAKIGNSLGAGKSSLADGLAPGKTYRASVWAYNSSNNISGASVFYSISGSGGSGSGTYTNANSDGTAIRGVGNWYLINLNITIPSTGVSGQILSVGLASTGVNEFDDFRFQPVDAPMTSYVYDNQTGRLTHVLDNNNFYTRYVYDDAGRLTTTYKETKNGEKKTSSTVYHSYGM